MRTLTAILLLLLFTAQTELGQLLRLPFAVQHYIAHREENKGLTLVDFLKEHYNAHHDDGDMTADKQLPFNNYNSEILTLVYVPTAPPETALQPAPMSQKPFTFFTGAPLCARSFAIFHPPQTV